MKKQLLIFRMSAVVIVVGMLADPAQANNVVGFDAARKELRAVTAAELPAKAAQLVSQSPSKTRAEMAEAVVAAALALRPAAAIAAVCAIARQNPDVASVAVAKAAKLRPKEAVAIARAAAGAAPAQAGEIILAVCRALPAQAGRVTATVLHSASNVDRHRIWAVLTAAGPVVENPTPSPLSTMNLAMLPPPVFGPPFLGGAPPPIEITRTNTIEVPLGGGRDYGGP